MIPRYSILAAALLAMCAAASAQVQKPVDSAVVLRNPITSTQARELARTFEQRAPAEALTVDPDRVRAAAGAQTAAVEVSGSNVIPADAAASPPSEPAPAVATRVDFLRATPRDEVLLKRAIAGQDALKSALSLESSSLITLPGVVRMTAAEGSELNLKPFILVNRPLQRGESGMFEGELLVGVTEIVDSQLTRQLPTPLLFEIVGAVKSVPERVLIETTSPPFRRVRVIIDTVQDRAAKLLIVSVIDRKGTEISLPLAGELSVGTSSDGIEGLGLETAEVNVILGGSNAAKRKVTLNVRPSGYLDRSILTLDADGAAQTELRSGWIGAAVITATNPDFRAATKEIHYRLPYRTLGASLFGALLGAIASYLIASSQVSRPTRRIAGAALIGVIVFALYAVGVNVLPVEPKVTVGAIFVFAVSALGAFIAPSLAKRWSGSH